MALATWAEVWNPAACKEDKDASTPSSLPSRTASKELSPVVSVYGSNAVAMAPET